MFLPRAIIRYLAAFPLTLLDVLAAESPPAAARGISPSNPAPAGATPCHTPLSRWGHGQGRASGSGRMCDSCDLQLSLDIQ